MQKRNVKTDTACALYESRACAILHQRSCEECPMHQDRGADAEKTAEFVERFQALLPEGGIAPLFESETCTLCKTEPKGERSAYAIVDFGHSEPKELAKRKLLQKAAVGYMVPLQFACCKKCRSRILLCNYLPMLAPTALTALVLPFVVNPHWFADLRGAASWLPLALVAGAIAIGYAAGKVLQQQLGKRFDREMYFDVLSHPMAEEMRKKGWFPLFGDKQPQPVFTRKRMRYGIGTASSRELNADFAADPTAEPDAAE